MDYDLAAEALSLALGKQKRYDFAPASAEKMEAKAFAAAAVRRHLPRWDTARVLDVGHEPYYAHLFPGVTAANLPEHDLHDLRLGRFDAVLAMHVLEHSPFPLLALLSLGRSLVPGGVLYVSVPIVDAPFLTDPCHFSVLHHVQWRKLFGDAGLRVLEEGEGKFNSYRTAVEWRFVLGR